jgi:hypothetical protein
MTPASFQPAGGKQRANPTRAQSHDVFVAAPGDSLRMREQIAHFRPSRVPGADPTVRVARA